MGHVEAEMTTREGPARVVASACACSLLRKSMNAFTLLAEAKPKAHCSAGFEAGYSASWEKQLRRTNSDPGGKLGPR